MVPATQLARRSFLTLLAAASLLAVHAILGFSSIPRQAVTFDEFAHLPAGISHWQRGTFFMYSVNPPASKMLAAFPVLFAEPRMTYDEPFRGKPGGRPEWPFGRRFMEDNRDRYFGLFFLGRVPMVLLSVIGGWFVFLWSRELFGDAAGLIGLSLWAFDPNVLAFSQLITPDIGAATAAVVSTYTFWRWLHRPSWSMAALAGVLMGLAQLTKFTLLLLYPVWAVLWLVSWFDRRHQQNTSARSGMDGWTSAALFTGQFVTINALSVLVLNAGYGFEGSFKRLGDYHFVSQTLTADRIRETAIQGGSGPAMVRYELVRENRFRGSFTGWIPVPLPEHYLLGIDLQKRDFENPLFLSYLRGELRQGGWWYYYLYAFGVKTPLGTLLLILASASLFVTTCCRSWLTEFSLLLPLLAVVTFVSSQTGFNHHLRYILPAYPFLFVFVSRVGLIFHTSPAAEGNKNSLGDVSIHLPKSLLWPLRALAVVGLLWNVASGLRVYPHSLSYFNELAGGPEHGGEHLINSNLDWGQDLLFLRDWWLENPEARPLKLAYFNFVDPAVAGISFELPPQFTPSLLEEHSRTGRLVGPVPGWHAVSANLVYGMSFTPANGKGGQEVAPARSYAYFQHFRPVAKAGYSIFIYHISLEEANRVRRILGLPPITD